MKLTPEQQQKQEYYRDARVTGEYGKIWQSVGKCVFCELDEKYVFYEENGVVMTVPVFAYVDGHIMVIPKRHVRSVKEITSSEWETMRKFFYLAKKMIREVHGVKGMQIVQKDGAAAQSTVEHIHFHCIPFDNPELSTWNYQQLEDTPYDNAEKYRAEREKLEKLSKRFTDKYVSEYEPKTDTKLLYKQALSEALIKKKQSRAKHTAKVGAALIAGDTIISKSNASLTDGVMEVEIEGTWTSPPTVSHAEERCVAAAARAGLPVAGSTMIVTLSPCMMCSRLIVNAGVKEVHYIHDWWDAKALEFLTDQGVTIRKLMTKKNQEEA